MGGGKGFHGGIMIAPWAVVKPWGGLTVGCSPYLDVLCSQSTPAAKIGRGHTQVSSSREFAPMPPWGGERLGGLVEVGMGIAVWLQGLRELAWFVRRVRAGTPDGVIRMVPWGGDRAGPLQTITIEWLTRGRYHIQSHHASRRRVGPGPRWVGWRFISWLRKMR